MFLDIIHRPVFIWNTVLLIFQNSVSETGFCLRLQVKPIQMGQIDGATPYLRIFLGGAPSIELVPISGYLCQHQDGVYKPNTAQTICES
jgi:hypothetical protein